MRYRSVSLSSGAVRKAATLGIAAAAAAAAAAGPVRAQETPAAPPAITVTGAVEVNYTYNLNRPFNNSNTYLYNTNEGQFSLNLADVRVARAATPESRTGFMVRLIEGEVKRRNFNVGEYAVNGEAPNVLEAYVTQLLPLGGRDVKVDFGQFVTHVGYETIDIGTNNFFSRNFLFQYPSPFYNAGVRAAFPVSATTTVTGFLLNRYNGAFDPGNRDLAPGFQVALVPSATSSLILNGLTSRENLGLAAPVYNKTQSILDLIYSNQLSPSTRIIFEGLYRFGKTADATSALAIPKERSYGTYGIAGYGIFTLPNGNVLGLRGEYLKQNDAANKAVSPLGLAYQPRAGADTAGKTVTLASITASYELRLGILPGARTLLEYRYDRAGDVFFPAKNAGAFKKDQSTFTLGQVYNF